MMRYNRQIILSEVGEKGQQKLGQAKVLIIGAGGLGAAILPYLAAAGIGEIGIIDDDAIEITNLQRQVIYRNDAIGKSKALEAKKMALSLNPSIQINAITDTLNAKNAIALFEYYDIMVDATDNLQTKYLINDACVVTNKAFVYGSIYKFQGQVSVFNYQNGPTYRCLFPDEKSNSKNCVDAGVMGISVGIIGMFQANEVLKMVLGIGNVLSGELLIYNMLTNDQQKFELVKSNSTLFSRLDFEKKYHVVENTVLEITANEALEGINNPEVLFLDVRNEDEFPKISLPNAIQIPLSDLEDNLSELDSNKKLLVYCQSGIRSKRAVEILINNSFSKVQSIAGGALKLEGVIATNAISI
ncbi:molybdenum cofactor biosynthesis protein MoeB [Flavobacterium glycines]|uniref:Molybdopterin-synthase adenylyltransferase n=2 Tax=Flavobacterium glycines TaxID=551990 RepID=A0A1B9DTA9_9FLAO|nr:HesA/MoeB/ThiF family protein [Flavobacterium glycines]OCB72932.1 thiamine biosynthesis protein ThiF [Flavobacterium glycines]GEL12166.1 molybdenum cofactor biosynthesis protein MoeB [Flavobacterium glycines]